MNKARLDEFNLYWNSASRDLYSPYNVAFDSYLEGMLRAFALMDLSFDEIEDMLGDLREYAYSITIH